MLSALSAGLIVTGACVLVAALFPGRRLIAQLPQGSVRSSWTVLNVLVGVFIAGYLGYAALSWGRVARVEQLIVPAIFFLGACFVWVSATLALQTAADVRRVSRLEYENITDPLTGAFNRRYMQRQLEQEFARAKRYGLPLTVMLLDIDHFKKVNDTHGHQVGDGVLRRLSQVTQDAVRDTDTVARYGGEEFLIIAPGSPSADAGALAERIRRSVAAQEFALGGDKRLQVAVSIGVASAGGAVDSIEALIQAADRALYRAKSEGRDRVVFDRGAEADAGQKASSAAPAH